jgi:predicted amidohydrolase
MLASKLKDLAHKSHIVVLPEMFTTGFTMNPATVATSMDGEAVQWMKNQAREGRFILTGSMIIEEDGNYFNRMLWVQPDGQIGYYDKRHLFAFAGEDKHYTAGSKRLITAAGGWKFLPLVCYDLRFPVWARQQEAPHGLYDILIYVANWPSIRSHAWKSLLVARAIENQCYVIGVNRCGTDGKDIYYSGDSMMVSPAGEIINLLSDQEGVLTHTFDKSSLQQFRNQFPFLKDADNFTII